MALLMFIGSVLLIISTKEVAFLVATIEWKDTLNLSTFGIISLVLSGLGAVLSGYKMIQ